MRSEFLLYLLHFNSPWHLFLNYKFWERNSYLEKRSFPNICTEKKLSISLWDQESKPAGFAFWPQCLVEIVYLVHNLAQNLKFVCRKSIEEIQRHSKSKWITFICKNYAKILWCEKISLLNDNSKVQFSSEIHRTFTGCIKWKWIIWNTSEIHKKCFKHKTILKKNYLGLRKWFTSIERKIWFRFSPSAWNVNFKNGDFFHFLWF